MKRIFSAIWLFFVCSWFLPVRAQNTDSTEVSEEYSMDSATEEESNTVEDIFESTRIINGHSTETLRKGVLEFRVEHRFGDIAGADGVFKRCLGSIIHRIFVWHLNMESRMTLWRVLAEARGRACLIVHYSMDL
jgi:hypothetical protein